MINPPQSRAEAEARKYGHYRAAYRPSQCAYEVWLNDRDGTHYQCRKSPGFGPDGIYCGQHDPAAIQKRKDKSREKFEQGLAGRMRSYEIRDAYYKALTKIAESHCSKCAAIAKEVLDRS